MTGRVSASRILDAKVDDVFSVVTDIARLREWNTAITAVIEQPDSLHPLTFWQRTLLVGIRSRRLEEDIPEWKRAGLPIAAGTGG